MSTYDPSHLNLLNAVASAVFMTRDGRIVFANTAAQSLLGLPHERLIHRRINDFIHPDFHDVFQDNPSTCEIRLLPTPEGECWVECSTASTTFEGNPCWLITAVDITSRRQQLRESENRAALLYRMIDSIPDEIYMKDQDCRFIVANRATWSGSNYPSEAAILGLNDVDVFGKYGIPFLENEQRLITEQRSIINYEYLTSHDSERKRPPDWLLITKVPLYDDDGKPQGIVGVNRNINDYKKAEAALDESRRLVERITETMPDVIYIFDWADKTNLYVNPQVFPVLGYTPEEIKQMGDDLLSRITHPDDLHAYLTNLERLTTARDSDVIEIEQRARHANGDWRWFFVRETILSRDAEGKPRQILGIAQDITARKRAEANRQQIAVQQGQQARMLDEILSATLEFITLFDQAGRYQYLNQSALKRLSVRLEDALGHTLRELNVTPPAVCDRLEGHIRKVFETGQPVFYDEQTAISTGAVNDYQVIISPVHDAVGQISAVVLVSRDVTERNAMQKVLFEQERMRVALEKEQEVSDLKTRLMITIAHEFRTPLTVISTSGYLLERQLTQLPDARPHYHFRQIQNAIEHLSDMLDDIGLIIQGVFKRLMFIPAFFDLDTLCRHVIDECRSHSEGRAIEFSLTGDHSALIADEHIIRRVLTILLDNAIQYSSAETTVRLDVTVENQAIILSVRDEGIGIPAEDQAQIFEPLYRGSNIGEAHGLGLGLAIVKDAVDLHGGTISVTSAPGQGTTFTVRLPAG